MFYNMKLSNINLKKGLATFIVLILGFVTINIVNFARSHADDPVETIKIKFCYYLKLLSFYY